MQAFPAVMLGSWTLGGEGAAMNLPISVDIEVGVSGPKQRSSGDFARTGSRETEQD